MKDLDNINLPEMSCKWHNKKLVSPTMYSIWLIIATCASIGIIAMAGNYLFELGSTFESKMILVFSAVSMDLVLMFFALFCISRGTGKALRTIAFIFCFALTAFSVTSFMVSQQFEADHKSDKIQTAYTASLAQDPLLYSGTPGQKAAVRDRMERALHASSKITTSPQTAVYKYASSLLGVSKETFVFLFRAFWAIAALLGVLAIKSFGKEIFTERQLINHVNGHRRLSGLLNRNPAPISDGYLNRNPVQPTPGYLNRNPTPEVIHAVSAKGGASSLDEKKSQLAQ